VLKARCVDIPKECVVGVESVKQELHRHHSMLTYEKKKAAPFETAFF